MIHLRKHEGLSEPKRNFTVNEQFNVLSECFMKVNRKGNMTTKNNGKDRYKNRIVLNGFLLLTWCDA